MIPHVNPYPTRNLLHTLLWSRIWGPRDVVVAGSAVTARRYESLFGMRSQAIPTYGVDQTIFFPRDKAQSRRQLGLSRAPTLLYTGRFARDKNIGALLAVHRAIRQSVPDTQLIMAVTFEQPDYRDALRGQLDDVQVLHWVAADKLATLYSAADLFVSCATSYFETFGRSPAEARACGTPSVVPDWDGFPACIGDDGRLVPVDFLETPLYEQLSYAMINLPEMVRICQNELSSTRLRSPRLPEQFGASATTRRLRQLLQEVTAGASHVERKSGLETPPGNTVLQKIVDALGADDPQRLLALSTCRADELPFIAPPLLRKLYGLLFGP
jgi:glycosyltransferase involved in cell wall biosynthesis